MPAKDLNKLSRLVDDALAAAHEMGEKMTASILSVASLEVSLRIEAMDDEEPDSERSAGKAECRRPSNHVLHQPMSRRRMRA